MSVSYVVSGPSDRLRWSEFPQTPSEINMKSREFCYSPDGLDDRQSRQVRNERRHDLLHHRGRRGRLVGQTLHGKPINHGVELGCLAI